MAVHLPEFAGCVCQIENQCESAGDCLMTRAACERLHTARELNYASQDLTKVPEILFSAKSVTCLNLNYNNLGEIPGCLCSSVSTTLTTLRLKGNLLRSLPANVGDLAHLKLLDASENALLELPDTLCMLVKLETLKLTANKLKRLPRDMHKMASLRHVHLDENKVRHFPPYFGQLEQLTTLEIGNNRFRCLPEDAAYTKHLKCMNASNNRIQYLPQSIEKCHCLEELDISYNQIKFLPTTFASAAVLRKLYVDCNLLCTLPDWFGSLESLEELSMENNILQNVPLPDGFGEVCRKLRHFNFASNYLSALPSTFGRMSELEFVHLGSVLDELERRDYQNGNCIVTLPDSFGFLARLTQLRLDENQLIELPESFGELVMLERLDLCQNILKRLPESFSGLRSLQTCLLSMNFLECLPKNVGDLNSLTELRVDNNLLTELPESFGDLGQLEILDLFNNQLAEVPHCLQHLSSLRYLEIDQNRFSVTTEEIPKIIFANYAPRNPELKNNWRGRNRGEMNALQYADLRALEEKEDKKVGSSSLNEKMNVFTIALKQGSALWRSHTNDKAREKFDHASVAKKKQWQLSSKIDEIVTKHELATTSSSSSNYSSSSDSEWDEEGIVSTTSSHDNEAQSRTSSVDLSAMQAIFGREDWDKEIDHSNPFHVYEHNNVYKHHVATSLFKKPYEEGVFCPAIYHAKPVPRFYYNFATSIAASSGQFDDVD